MSGLPADCGNMDFHSSCCSTAAVAAAAWRRREHHPILHPFLPLDHAVQGFKDGVEEWFATQDTMGLSVEEGGSGGLWKEGRNDGGRGQWKDTAWERLVGLQPKLLT